MRLLPLASIVMAATLLLPAAARAAPLHDLPLELTWTAPTNCPGAASVRAGVERIVKDAGQATPVVADGRVVPVDGGFELVLSTRVDDVTETRAVTAPSCAPLAEAGAVLIALALDSRKDDGGAHHDEALGSGDDATADGAAPAPNEPLRAVEQPSNAREPAPARAKTPSLASPLQLGFGLAPTLDIGTLPDANAGLRGHADVRLGRFRAGVHGTAWLRQRSAFGGSATAGASFDTLQAALFGCFMTPVGGVRLGPCADIQANHIVVEGFGIRAPARQETVWPSFGAGLLADWTFGRFALFARADIVIPVGAPTFALATSSAGGMSLYSPQALAVRSAFGVEIVVP